MNLQYLKPGASSAAPIRVVSSPLQKGLRWAIGAVLTMSLVGCESIIPFLDTAHPQISIPSIKSVAIDKEQLNTTIESDSKQSVQFNSDKWLSHIENQYDTAKTLVEAELNVDLAHIDLLIVDDEPITREVARESRRLINAQFGESVFSAHFLGKVMDAQVGTYAALFTSKLDAVMVSRSMLGNFENSLPENKAIRDAALMTLLIHELVHAADEERYKIHENRALNFRASFAQSATFEGHAQWVTRKICKANQCLQGLQALDNFMFNRNAQPAAHSQPVEAISHNVLEYSYVEGERFIDALAKRENGEQLIDKLLSAPPEDPIQILAPDSFPNIAREQRNQNLIHASLDVDHPWVQGTWHGVQTSPLKGVNLRADPSQREAAIDGFTRLINSMISMQLYDQSEPDQPPIEVTVLQAETARTATLFARTLHDNAVGTEDSMFDESVIVKAGTKSDQSEMKAHIYRRNEENARPYRTTIAVSGTYLVQIAGESFSNVTMDDYAVRVLMNLKVGKLRL